MEDIQTTKELCDEMKQKEKESIVQTFDLDKPMYARLDGRAFHTFTSVLARPFDSDFTQVLRDTCFQLVRRVGAAIGYAHSDEIDLVWTKASKAPFGGVAYKLMSVLSGMASAFFNQTVMRTGSYKIKSRAAALAPHFDCFVMSISSQEDAEKMLRWRMGSSYRNAIDMIARCVAPGKNTFGMPMYGAKAVLRDAGVDLREDFDQANLYGTLYSRHVHKVPLPEHIVKLCINNAMPVPELCIKSIVEPTIAVSYDDLRGVVKRAFTEPSKEVEDD